MVQLRQTLALALAAASLLATACDKTPEPQSTPAPTPPHALPAQANSGEPSAAAPKGPSDVAYDVPEGYQKAENPSPMRKATYRFAKVEGDSEDAEMSVTQVGGSVEQNVKRWAGQFEGAKDDQIKRTKQKVGDLEVTVVEIHGTFNGSGMPGAPAAGPKPNWALLGAIVETQGQLTFFKMTGPEKTMAAAKPGFDKLVGSLRAK